ncbi:MAG: J domain-containing protein [Desulfatibacillum sp.]|nr:J domain-containing protein [Desulfatibacillum sp.]
MNNMESSNGPDSLVPVIPSHGRQFVCQACGATQNMGRRKYCSRACRQRLVWRLEVASNLLRALHTRYATFSFTPDTLIFHVVASGSPHVYSYLWRRTPGRKPADDLGALVEQLGRQWWREHERRRSRHQASKTVLEQAHTAVVSPGQVRPLDSASPKVSGKHLSILKLSKAEILGTDAREAVKSAYRRQVMTHHPDHNGDAALFRKVHEAYEEMKEWLENPVIRNQRGLPDKWSYDGRKWAPPMNSPTPRKI